MFLGELALDGKIQGDKGAFYLWQNAKSAGFEEIALAQSPNAKEAALIDGIKIFACEKLEDITNHFDKENSFALDSRKRKLIPIIFQAKFCLIFSDIKGQETVKRGLEIAAAGGHNVMMSVRLAPANHAR